MQIVSSQTQPKPFTVVIAPSGFKESLSSNEAADCMAAGVLQVMRNARVIKAPMADGGEGFTEALVEATGGTIHKVVVTGPVGQRVDSFFGILGNGLGPVAQKTAVLEMAAAAGLRLVPRDQRNPMLTTSFGVGELIRAALDAGAERILLGCGDSGINDGGAGMVQALGARFLDHEGRCLGAGGGELMNLHTIDLTHLDARLKTVQLDAAVNWHNVLLGERGVARVFGPQKGATPEQVVLLEKALERFAACIEQATGIAIGHAPGSGASGGLGAGFAGLLGGKLHPRYDIVMQYLELDRLLDEADLVLTAEGSLDEQTPRGKVPAEVAQRAKARHLPVVALAGTIGRGAEQNHASGIDAYASIVSRPCTLEDAIANASTLLESVTVQAMRMVQVGLQMSAERAQAAHGKFRLAA
jgi:glycerate 2-kinase